MRRLSFLIHSGMPIVSSIELLAAQTTSTSVSSVLKQIQMSVENGKSLSESFSEHPSLFGRFSTEVIAIGESSGTLSTNLAYLAGELKKKAELRAKLLGALIYPLIITLATIALTVSLILFIFPKILPVFSGLGVSLPWSTRLVLTISEFLQAWGLVTLCVLVLLSIAGCVAYKRSDTVKTQVSRFVLRVPILGSMITSYFVANVTRTLALLLRSGMTLRTALPATALATGHVLYRREIERLGDTIEQGGDLAAHLKQQSLFPDMVGQMVSVGESSGTLAETLGYISEFYEAELEETTKNLSTLVEPALMILMGLIVGFVAISMITPIYELTQHLHAK